MLLTPRSIRRGSGCGRKRTLYRAVGQQALGPRKECQTYARIFRAAFLCFFLRFVRIISRRSHAIPKGVRSVLCIDWLWCWRSTGFGAYVGHGRCFRVRRWRGLCWMTVYCPLFWYVRKFHWNAGREDATKYPLEQGKKGVSWESLREKAQQIAVESTISCVICWRGHHGQAQSSSVGHSFMLASNPICLCATTLYYHYRCSEVE